MKIDFSKVNVMSSDVDKISNKTHKAKESLPSNGYQLDISGIVKDDAVSRSTAYDGQGMTWDEYLQEKGVNSSLYAMGEGSSMLRRNYMAVMSNSMSTEDFAKLKKEGYNLKTMDPQEAVTVVEQIKVKLIEAGVHIEGYTDTIDKETIDSITGNKGLSEQIQRKLSENDLPVTEENVNSVVDALDMVSQISKKCDESGRLTDDTLKLFLTSYSDISIENVFFSSFQSGNNVRAVDFEENNYEKLISEIERVISNSGLFVNTENINNAKWLLNNNLSLSEDTLLTLSELKEIKFPIDSDKIIDNISDALSLGMKAEKASLITSRRVLLEVRLSMTAEANVKLLSSDYSIDTKEMEKELDELIQLEDWIKNKSNTESNNYDLFTKTNERIAQIRELPAAVVAKFDTASAFTINDVYESGNRLKADYEKANASYEALRTEIRRDLGDNIKTAFRNAEELLKEINVKSTEANLRAVRILGYNQMEITVDNISKVKAADQQISRLIDNLNPANVMRLIKKGINPLIRTVSELNDTLDSFKDEDYKNEKYSEYLVKLEHNDKISEQERESFVGIFRLIRQIEESDGAVIGSLINSQAELSIKNLISSVRSRKAAGVDVSINDSFGVLEDLPVDGNRIDVQISQAFDQPEYYEKETSDLLSTLNPEKLHNMWKEGKLTANTTIEELFEGMSEDNTDEEIEKLYYQEEAQQFRENIKTSEEVEQLLKNIDVPINAENLIAAANLLKYRGNAFRNLKDLSDNNYNDRENESFSGLFEEIRESLIDEESMQQAYEKLAVSTKAMINTEIANSAMTADEFRRIMLLSKQITIISSMAKEESYEVPIETENGYTSINLKIVKGSVGQSVLATMSLPDIGDLVAHMLVDDGKVSGYMMAETDNGLDFLFGIKEELDEKLDTELIVSKKDNLEINKRLSKKENLEDTNKVSTSKLYSIAKSFVIAVSNKQRG